MDLIKSKSASAKLSLLSGALGLVTLIIFCVYGAVYDYFDTVVFLTLALGVACAAGYALLSRPAAELLNLAAGMRGMTMFTADPADTAPGSAHSYTIHGGNWAQGPLELLPDGTFTAHETGGGPVNASTIQGTWVDHGDGTATLNYDHSTIVIE